ncbi:CGNR zinc finger domain-containing protein [Lentzea sp. CA-135723]|uniref:CGNR zinc finger domain-containing protein n=1 Tax=Lentzea sp. CA-135723 TaxID=3239950 RepID=UPI003D937694
MDEALLLDLLNTTPVLDDGQHDLLAEDGPGWLTSHDQPASKDELRALTAARDALQAVVRGTEEAAVLAPFVEDVRQRAGVDSSGVVWHLDLPEGRTAAARAVLAWDAVRVSSPGRLRPCANPDCRLFLIDHSKPNSARWCSMAVCGNRMKARRHYQRTRGER